MPSDLSKSNLSTVLLFSIIPVFYYVQSNILKQDKKRSKRNSSLFASALFASSAAEDWNIRPPFPPVIRKMLSSCRLAYLSTVESDSSHLSLMRFTYINDEDDGEVIIMTTKKKTKKFTMLQKQNGVALLIHDFSQFKKSDNKDDDDTKEGKDGVLSITLNGRCTILEDGNKAEMYRAKHLAHNPDYPQFIVGENVSVLCVNITSARICDINDQVTKWNVKDGDNNH
jgi:nitroimidazol reductase NimA-like FMN-containing flavoprotein (pyridoxamine 5'-phosphate oxidase superfamily)